jgi:glycosyltransferase involved in cell wall biosynthesis
VLSVNDHMTERFAARYGDRLGRKCVTIPNGFDASDFSGGDAWRPQKEFRLLHAGSLYKTRSPTQVLEAFRRFIDAVPGSRQHARFEFAGRPGPHTDLLQGEPDDGTVKYVGMLPHAQTLRTMESADVNVVLLPNVPGSENDTTAKLYECLGSGRPILAAVPLNGAAARVLRDQRGVWLCDPDDVEGMSRAMTELYRRWLAGDAAPARSAEDLRVHTRQYQTRRLAACLDAAVRRSRRVAGGQR